MFLIPITTNRFDPGDAIAIEVLGKILSEEGVSRIHLVFTQVDRMDGDEDTKTKAIDDWKEHSF